ncbi:MAG: 30S ribosomal protein S2, partial [Campylobacter sp.]|nr:30S ribosomal protein S2 [Campylobacter sp.]
NEMAEAINEGKAMMDPEVAVANEEAISEAEKQEVLEEAMSEEE